MSGKYALIIGNTEYNDPGLAQLTAPGKDAEDFSRVLSDREICGFEEVKLLLNQAEYLVRGAIDEFFDQKKPDDLLVLYFSGHGVRDELGSLYLAVKNTLRTRLRSTAIKSDYIREAMDQSRSRRQVLILDCCNSGAFEQGTKAATGVSLGTASAFEAGYGRIILTASDTTQFAWEGEKVIGVTDNSLFTHFLVEGLEGEADLDGDGRITVDELYDYAYEKVKLATPKQTPSKFSSKQQGEIVLRQITRMEDIKPVSLPNELTEAIDDSRTFVREGAVQQLEKLLYGKNLGLARSAREALERIEKEDDSRRVSEAAAQALEPFRQAEQAALQKAQEKRLVAEKLEAEQKAKQEAEQLLVEQKAEEKRKARELAERLALQKAEEERLAHKTAEAERRAKEAAQQLAQGRAEGEREVRAQKTAPLTEEIETTEKTTRTLNWNSAFLVTLGWAFAGAIGGVIYWTGGDWVGDFNETVAGAIDGVIGGLITAVILRIEQMLSNGKSILWIALAWAVGGAIGWTIGEAITDAYGAAIGGAIAAVIGLTITLRFEKILSHRNRIFWIILLGWAIAWTIGWIISRYFQFGETGGLIGWSIGRAIGGAIGGYILSRQLLNNTKMEP